jgi:hypothetical protein
VPVAIIGQMPRRLMSEAEQGSGQRGLWPVFADAVIQMCLTLKERFGLPSMRLKQPSSLTLGDRAGKGQIASKHALDVHLEELEHSMTETLSQTVHTSNGALNVLGTTIHDAIHSRMWDLSLRFGRAKEAGFSL